MEDTLAEAERRGVRFFTAADYIDIRYTGPGEDTHEHDGEHEHEEGAPDPHIWTDPTAMRSVILALAEELEARFGLELSGRASDLSASLDQLDAEIAGLAAGIPEIQRELVTGHESLGYFARRYGFHLVGAVIPSLTSQAEVSAADLAALKELILEHQVKVIFTETGTPSAVAAAVSRETGARLVELNTHLLPADGSYFTMMREMARTIVEALE
jgi:zinc/manganese transport system substrate-binding protein